jgi:pimeloyl-ACP methyl ester carboxylesterase
MMQTHVIKGAKGTNLHVEESGSSEGPAIRFIHGISQSAQTWRRQLDSQLSREFRLVALDLRGHGRSDKPEDGYAEPRVWADDVHAVIQGLGLARPVLVGWSYGGFVVCDYVRFYGEHDISGINFAGAATKISQETAPDILGAEFLALLPGLFSQEVDRSIRTLRDFGRICSERELDAHDSYLTLGFSAIVPPAVRLSMLSRTIDNDDLLPALTVPVLISHGERDRIVHTAVARQHAELIPNARLSTYARAGHAVFLDEPERFNLELADFARSAATGPAALGERS